jgi:hypothetical protein
VANIAMKKERIIMTNKNKKDNSRRPIAVNISDKKKLSVPIANYYTVHCHKLRF